MCNLHAKRNSATVIWSVFSLFYFSDNNIPSLIRATSPRPLFKSEMHLFLVILSVLALCFSRCRVRLQHLLCAQNENKAEKNISFLCCSRNSTAQYSVKDPEVLPVTSGFSILMSRMLLCACFCVCNLST